MKNFRKNLTIALVFIAVFTITLFAVLKVKSYIFNKKIDDTNEQIVQEAKKEIPTQTQGPKPTGYLEVPFICQAPLETVENWKSHEESCEEAALLQAYLYINNKTLTKPEANTEILKMIDWEVEYFGLHKDLDAEGVKIMAMKFLNIKEDQLQVTKNATIEDIKKAINDGNPVIVPITGEILKNPYYPYPGYHMLVAIGYTDDKIITNDNGTKRGKDFSYDIAIFENAMRDAGDEILVLKKN